MYIDFVQGENRGSSLLVRHLCEVSGNVPSLVCSLQTFQIFWMIFGTFSVKGENEETVNENYKILILTN